ncbi:MAG: AMP-binding protein [Endomicrobiaceae bacterium]
MILDKFIKSDFSSYEDFALNYKVNVPENFNFGFDVVDATAQEEPGKKCLVWCNDKGEHKLFTFEEMKKQSNKAANFFRTLGIKKGDFVMLILKRRYEYWISVVALHKIGAVVIPATHLLMEKDIVYRNNAADVKMIIAVCEDDLIERINNAQKESPTLKYKVCVNGSAAGWHDFKSGIEKQSEIFERPCGADATQNNDPFLIYFTSGTTSMPKMALHDFTYPLGHITTAKFWQNVEENGAHLTLADTGWAKAAWGKIYGQWIAGCAVFVYDFDKFTPTDILDVISNNNVTSFCGPSTVYRYLIKEDLSKYDFSRLKYCCVAGEALNPEVFNKWEKLTGHKIMEGFGQSESAVMVANFIWIKPKPGSMGKPSPVYDVDIIDDDGTSCEPGKEGNLVINVKKGKPLGLFCEYYKSPDKTAEVWKNGYYYTGDVVYKDEDGYFWFVGRADDVIKSSGYRIGPFEVESALIEHPAVLECAITAVPDPYRGQIVKATVVLSKGYSPSDSLVVELQNHVKKVTAPYKYPRVVEFVNELPKTISGKIRKVEIREADSKK